MLLNCRDVYSEIIRVLCSINNLRGTTRYLNGGVLNQRDRCNRFQPARLHNLLILRGQKWGCNVSQITTAESGADSIHKFWSLHSLQTAVPVEANFTDLAELISRIDDGPGPRESMFYISDLGEHIKITYSVLYWLQSARLSDEKKGRFAIFLWELFYLSFM